MQPRAAAWRAFRRTGGAGLVCCCAGELRAAARPSRPVQFPGTVWRQPRSAAASRALLLLTNMLWLFGCDPKRISELEEVRLHRGRCSRAFRRARERLGHACGARLRTQPPAAGPEELHDHHRARWPHEGLAPGAHAGEFRLGEAGDGDGGSAPAAGQAGSAHPLPAEKGDRVGVALDAAAELADGVHRDAR